MNTPVNFEIAKVLKEKGFDEITQLIYMTNHTTEVLLDNINNLKHSDGNNQFISAPTIAEAVMWLYENRKRHLVESKEEQKQHLIDMMRYDEDLGLYEEPKQETLEEASKRILANNVDGLRDLIQDDDLFFFYKGVIEYYGEAMAKWQQERMYSEEELLKFGKSCFYKGFSKSENDDANCYTAFREEIGSLFEQFKNK